MAKTKSFQIEFIDLIGTAQQLTGTAAWSEHVLPFRVKIHENSALKYPFLNPTKDAHGGQKFITRDDLPLGISKVFCLSLHQVLVIFFEIP